MTLLNRESRLPRLLWRHGRGENSSCPEDEDKDKVKDKDKDKDIDKVTHTDEGYSAYTLKDCLWQQQTQQLSRRVDWVDEQRPGKLRLKVCFFKVKHRCIDAEKPGPKK